ncbi:MAG TPA: class I SAM-dependent methyltransferase [Cytophagaceae bacterium]|jgi:SAM-dependent methyltransferase|nr:class I SAM-dependent methyltransferase [Cytophagaceae bacterium]
MDWFSEWFDSPYYHILYKNRDLKEAELFIDKLTAYLNLPAQARIIDIPCGKGRHCIYLNKKGFHVSGADLSPENIHYAQQFSNDHLDFFIHDMRDEFAHNKFDAVLNIFTSFGYFEDPADDQRCIHAFAKALKPGGKLVIDFMNLTKVLQELVTEESKTVDGVNFLVRKKVVEGRIVKDILFSDQGHAYHFQEKVTVLYKEDFLKYFTFAGLKIKSIFGDYQLNAFDPENSDRLILIAEK